MVVKASPSGSDDSPLQVSTVLVVTPVFGVITTALKLGLLLSRVMLAELLSLPPSESFTVTAHSMISVGEAMPLLRVRVLLLPNAAPVVRFVQV